MQLAASLRLWAARTDMTLAQGFFEAFCRSPRCGLATPLHHCFGVWRQTDNTLNHNHNQWHNKVLPGPGAGVKTGHPWRSKTKKTVCLQDVRVIFNDLSKKNEWKVFPLLFSLRGD